MAFRLVGTRSNRDAIGSTVRLTVKGRPVVRIVQAAGGYLAQSSKTVYFAFPEGSELGSVEIVWPSGKRQALPAPDPVQVHVVTEPRS